MNKTIKCLFNIRKSLVIREDKILPIDNKLLSTLKRSLYTLCVLNLERLRGIPERLRIANNFVQFILKMKRNHGLSFTIKWLKASTVAFQKWLGKDIINSLRVIEPGLPLPRVINGCPAIISRDDRLAIRNGNIHLYRFWHSLLSIYRILDMPGKMKIETILSPFTGDQSFLEEINSSALSYKWPSFLSDIALNQNLAPRTFIFSSKASPSNSLSYQGILTDIAMLMTSPAGKLVFENMMLYLSIIGTKWNTKMFLSRFQDAVDILSLDNFSESFLKFKKSPKLFGQLSIKKEAAGKIRVFALVDSITQSVLRPLHLGLFSVLRALPNDGTFDQEASVRRCQQKALKYQCAYSFDLSAATDRLPVQLTGSVFESLFQINGLGNAWQSYLVERDFAFPDSVIDEFDLNSLIPGFTNSIRYSVGQPMGALSSWAGLAITHHWIMQCISFDLFNISSQKWEDRYEILGDDIVIFDSSLASRYLEVMKSLGVDINLSKSIISKQLPVFEFAKRTSINDTIVSGITLSQIRSGVTLSSRVANLSSWVKNGLILAPFVMEYYLGNKPWLKEVGSLALFNIFKKDSREEVIDALVNPKYGVEFNMEDHEFGIPCRQLLVQVSNMVIGAEVIPLSKSEDRREWTLEMTPEISAEILKVALFKAKGITNRNISFFNELAKSMVNPETDISLLPSITGWVEDCYLNILDDKTNDPYELEDLVEGKLVYHAKTSNVSLDEAYELLAKVEKMDFLFTVPVKRKTSEFDDLSNPLLSDVIRGPFSKSPNYWDLISLNSEI